VEVIAEFDTWRQIRDVDGAEGWVHQSMLSGRRTGVVKPDPAQLRREGNERGAVVANLDPGVIVNVLRCPADSDFCRVEVGGLQGWLKRDRMWGVYPTETIQ
jgi:SH3-like domain-containing protein